MNAQFKDEVGLDFYANYILRNYYFSLVYNEYESNSLVNKIKIFEVYLSIMVILGWRFLRRI